MSEQENPTIFLSHNTADKEFVRRLTAALAATGARAWFDEWTIRPGDSIPGAIEGGISSFDTFALVWSEASSKSRWVKTEMEAAFTRWLAACLWYTFTYNHIFIHPEYKVALGRAQKGLIDRATKAGISIREWADSALGKEPDYR